MKENINSMGKIAKFFIIFKLVMSIVYFIIPSFFIWGYRFIGYMFFFVALGRDGAFENVDVSNITRLMIYIGASSIIPAIICIILFIIALISTIKFFRNVYSKKMDLFISFVLAIVSIALLGFMFWLPVYTVIIIFAIVIILLLDIIFIIRDNKKAQTL